jgi:transcriptional regulator GlxA family with amidase domain
MKEHTGRTVVEWITHSRMALARQFLLTTDEPIDAIATRVGYASSAHFQRTFRRVHHTSPHQWRLAHR